MLNQRHSGQKDSQSRLAGKSRASSHQSKSSKYSNSVNNRYKPQIINNKSIGNENTKRAKSNRQQIQWEAVYIQGKFFLGKPEAIQRLAELERQIRVEKDKITQNNMRSFKLNQGQSFYSHDCQASEPKLDQEDGCITEFDNSRLVKKQLVAQSQLVQAEEACRDNIKRLKKKKYQGDKSLQKCIQTIPLATKQPKVKNQVSQKQQSLQYEQQTAVKGQLHEQQNSKMSRCQDETEVLLKVADNFISFQPSLEQSPRFNDDQNQQKIDQHSNSHPSNSHPGEQSSPENVESESHSRSSAAKHSRMQIQKRPKSNSLWAKQKKGQKVHANSFALNNRIHESLDVSRQNSKEFTNKNSLLLNHVPSSTQIENLNRKIVDLQQQLQKVQERQHVLEINATKEQQKLRSGSQNSRSESVESGQRSSSKVQWKEMSKEDQVQVLPCDINNKTMKKQGQIQLDNTLLQNETLQVKSNNEYRADQPDSVTAPKSRYGLGIASSVMAYNNREQQKQIEQKLQKDRMQFQIEHLRKTIRQLKLQRIFRDQKDTSQLANDCFIKKLRHSQVYPSLPIEREHSRTINYDTNHITAVQHLDPNDSSQIPRPNFLQKLNQKHQNRGQDKKQILPVTLNGTPAENRRYSPVHQDSINDQFQKLHRKDMGKIIKNSPSKTKDSSNLASKEPSLFERPPQSIYKEPSIKNSHKNFSIRSNQKSKHGSELSKSKATKQNGRIRKNSELSVDAPSCFNDTVKSMATKKGQILGKEIIEKKQNQVEMEDEKGGGISNRDSDMKNDYYESKASERFPKSEFNARDHNRMTNSSQLEKMNTIELPKRRKQSESRNFRVRQTPTEVELARKGSSSSKQDYPKKLSYSINHKIFDQDNHKEQSLDKKGVIIHQVPETTLTKRSSSKDTPESMLKTSKVQKAVHQSHKKNTEFDKMSDNSNDEGRKIFELEFSTKKKGVQIPESELQEQEENYRPPQIKVSNLKHPQIPNPPKNEMSPKQQIELAISTFKLFEIKLGKNHPESQLKMTKYKNCILFSIDKSNEKILWHYSGKFYIGGWKQDTGEGCKSGQGFEFIPEKHAYKGQFLNGKRQGTGKAQYPNGNVYDGQWQEGNRHGRGKFFDKDHNSYYEGEWRNNKKDGFGCSKISEKEYYIGTWTKSIKNGHGIEIYANGDSYKGQFVMGKYHGKGKYFWANGSYYDGQFHQGFRQGHGKWRSAKKGGDCYIGQYKKDKKEGYGRYVWANGCCYQGEFHLDNKHGDGRMIYEDKRQMKGKWNNGQLFQVDGVNTQFPANKQVERPIERKGHQLIGTIVERPSQKLEKPGKMGKF